MKSASQISVRETALDRTACSVSSRQARREAAESRRKTWRLRWIEIGRLEIAAGRTMHDAIREIGHDAERLWKQTPALKSEIIRAFEEWTTALCAAVIKVREQDSPNTDVSEPRQIYV